MSSDDAIGDGIRIECASCAMQFTDHCRDCVVQAIVAPDPRRKAVVVDADEQRALRELARAGLVPEIRMKPKVRSA